MKEYLILEMLELRKLGMTYNQLSYRYGMNVRTVKNHCNKYNVRPLKFGFSKNKQFNEPYIFKLAKERAIKAYYQRNVTEETEAYKYQHILEEKINKGANYEDYLRRSGQKIVIPTLTE